MRKLLLFFLSLSSLEGSAQYFGHDYTPNCMIGNGGVTRRVPGPGHFLIGVSPFGNNGNGVNVVMTTINGNMLTNQTYPFARNSGDKLYITNALGIAPLPEDTVSAVEVVFSYEDPASGIGGIGHFPAYAPGATVGFAFGGVPQPYTATVTGATQYVYPRGVPTNYLVTGQLLAAGEDTYIFTMGFASGGGQGLGNVYKINTVQKSYVTPRDIMWNPDLNEIYIVGDITFPGQPLNTTDAFCLTLDGMGNVIKCDLYDAGEYDGFTAIYRSVDPRPGGTGFIIAGNTQSFPGLVSKPWVTKTDQNNNMVWSNIYESPILGDNVVASDIIGRLNTSGDYEYYVTGQKGQWGVRDILSIKMDADGTVVPQGMGAYGILGDDSYATSIDFKNAGPGVGLSFYGQHTDMGASPNPSSYAHLRKTYFNGVSAFGSGCLHLFDDGITAARSVSINPVPAARVGGYVLQDVYFQSRQNNTDNALCFETAIPEGSNARVAAANNEVARQFEISPNPATDILNFDLGHDADWANARLIVTNVQGQINMSYPVEANHGSINVSDLPAGLYFVEFKNKEASKVVKFIKL
ncbi:MAG TPA: T9SS type A sorting domain-containing protein [Flavipsychrobacter sp.]|nr:T9SS type A sorting domain-containing protein [Flavipsychrobacter sp.]